MDTSGGEDVKQASVATALTENIVNPNSGCALMAAVGTVRLEFLLN
jgi:hypothetical protein